MKIAFTVSDACAAAHVGGNVNIYGFTVEVDDASIPDRLKRAIKDSKDTKAFTAVSCFIIDEDEQAARADAGKPEPEREHRPGQIDQLITERDEAEEAMSQAYLLVTGHPAEWSNNFNYGDALIEMTEVVTQSKVDENEALEELLREAAATVHASFVEPDISNALREYRRGLEQRLLRAGKAKGGELK